MPARRADKQIARPRGRSIWITWALSHVGSGIYVRIGARLARQRFVLSIFDWICPSHLCKYYLSGFHYLFCDYLPE
ncbi:hypothetical protein K504DRAFT_255495 [Pleomassaria siparia CBS 279.74]|uniref:Uncharacterized protein n=1 Tax=Pleomassaria siparia CBS 279.74 TaxID=1314801 RepID=A0A6G1KBJ3_9PLEO|nr:hypothetical protein K504DRAFT_255495 [Pleomassaria siparia CBS 279.74]